MQRQTYSLRKAGRYYVRCRFTFGSGIRNPITRSLGTADPVDARRIVSRLASDGMRSPYMLPTVSSEARSPSKKSTIFVPVEAHANRSSPSAGGFALPKNPGERYSAHPHLAEDVPLPPPTTIFERQSRLAQELGAINLGQGFPDMVEIGHGPCELLDAATRALAERSSQYPPMRGLPALRSAIVDYYAREQGLALGADEVVVTSGATEALAATLLALIRPGDEVVLVQPLYDAYLPLVHRAGGVARFVDLTPPDWQLPLADLAAAINDRTRVLLINTPNNPAGSAIGADEWDAIAALCERHDVTLVCDEVWEAMIFAGTHVSPLSIPRLRERTVKIGSAGKIFSLTGWKVGWVCAAPALADAIAATHQFLTFTTATPLQWAVAEGLMLPPEWHVAHRAPYRRARDLLAGHLAEAGYAVLPSQATWFVIVDLAASGVALDDKEFARRALVEAGVATIPVSAFYAERTLMGYVRLCFAKNPEVLTLAAEKLATFRRSLL